MVKSVGFIKRNWKVLSLLLLFSIVGVIVVTQITFKSPEDVLQESKPLVTVVGESESAPVEVESEFDTVEDYQEVESDISDVEDRQEADDEVVAEEDRSVLGSIRKFANNIVSVKSGSKAVVSENRTTLGSVKKQESIDKGVEVGESELLESSVSSEKTVEPDLSRGVDSNNEISRVTQSRQVGDVSRSFRNTSPDSGVKLENTEVYVGNTKSEGTEVRVGVTKSSETSKEINVEDSTEVTGLTDNSEVSRVSLKDFIGGAWSNADKPGSRYVYLANQKLTEEKIEVYVTVECKQVLEGGVECNDESAWKYVPEDGLIVSKSKVVCNKGENVWDVVARTLNANSIDYAYTGDPPFIHGTDSISSVYGTCYLYRCNHLEAGNASEDRPGPFGNSYSGWTYTVNGVYPGLGMNGVVVRSGDDIVLKYYTGYHEFVMDERGEF